MYCGKICDFSTRSIIDTVLAVWFAAPNSYTGEDVVEIHAHGNPLILDRIVTQCVTAGARLAEPGEFTRRAFLNGRMDLAQAEAVADLIAASSDQGIRHAQAQLQGHLSTTIRTAMDRLTTIRAQVEAAIDFPEEDIEWIGQAQLGRQVAELRDELARLAATFTEGRLYREGARLVFLGAPNVGKSSLFNRLAGEERAIVHSLAGTTRDCIEAQMVWDGIALTLVDTAGLRAIVADTSGHEAIEAIGMERARAMGERADLRVVVIDGSLPWDQEAAPAPADLPSPTLVWCNKSDRQSCHYIETLRTYYAPHPVLMGSAQTGEGTEALRRSVLELLRGGRSIESAGLLITNRRHKLAIDVAIQMLDEVGAAMAARRSPDLLAEHLRMAATALGRIVGEVSTEALLGEIFQRFCIGK